MKAVAVWVTLLPLQTGDDVATVWPMLRVAPSPVFWTIQPSVLLGRGCACLTAQPLLILLPAGRSCCSCCAFFPVETNGVAAGITHAVAATALAAVCRDASPADGGQNHRVVGVRCFDTFGERLSVPSAARHFETRPGRLQEACGMKPDSME